ncbi:MAG: DNA polymerase III subunit gamma/tau [Bacteroidales bacterium]|nr:DNA polymerase III subunit gamma/tau [Bacteroidales bacterium]
MAQYIVSARKYRPDSFESLIGQDNIARTLKNSILRGQLAHAYLFCGPRGVGKTSAARIFAKTINCAHPGPDMEPCGECESCVSFREGRSYCIHELDAASNNGVEDIKALMEQVQIPPQVGKYSVYIIDEVHMLTQSAFNAFLKTLEEPPAHAIFILATTEKHKIIPTILSRCQTYDFNRIGIPDIVRNLRDIAGKEGVNVDDESLHVIAHKADGAMRDALTIFDQTVAFCGTDIKYDDVIRNLGVLDYEYSFRLVDAFLAKDYGTALLVFDEILSKGFNALHFISSLGSHLRDLLVSRTGGLDALLDLPASLRERYREQAGRCSVRFLYDALGVISQCEAGYRASTNQRLHIEYALMRIAFLGGVPEGSAGAVSAGAGSTAQKGSPEPSASLRPSHASVGPSHSSGHGRPLVPESPSASVPPAPAETAPAAPSPASPSPVASSSSSAAASPLAAVPEPSVISTGAERSGEIPSGKEISRQARDDKGMVARDDKGIVAREHKGMVDRDDKEKPAAKPSKKASGLSLSSLMNGEEITVELAPEEEKPAEQAALPGEDTVKAKWPDLAATCSSQPRLAVGLANARLETREEDGNLIVSFGLVNKAQCDWINKHKLRDLEESFSAMLDCKRLRLEPFVIPEEEQENKIYMPTEKAKDLMSRNPEVAELVKDLALDIR